MKKLPNPKNLRKNQRLSRKQEKRTKDRVARATGSGFLTKGSGNQSEKGDVLCRGVIRVENKTTTKGSYSLKLSDFNKLNRACRLNGELPCFEIQFTDDSGKEKLSVVAIPARDFYDMLKETQVDGDKE